MSGGGGNSQSTQMPSWVQPYAKQFLQASTNVANRPYQGYDGQTVAQLNPYQTAGYNAQAQRALQGSGVNNAASDELTKTLSGGYLGGNPYMDSMVDKAQGDVVRNYNMVTKPQTEAAMVRSGSFGNSGLQQYQNEQGRALGDTLGNISTQMRGQDYANERGRMVGSIGMAPTIANQDYVDADRLIGAGQGFQQQEQANLSDEYGRFQEARDYPNQQLATLGKGLGMNYGSTTSGGAQTNPWAQGAGLGLSMYGASQMGGSGGGK